MGEGKGKKSYREGRREGGKPKRLLKTENKLRVDGGWEAGESG